MVKEDSSFEMEPHDEFVEMVTPVGEPNFHLLSPTPVSDSNCCSIQSVCVLPLSTIDHSGVDRQTEERSKEYLRRRKLEEIKKGKYIALDPKDQGRSVNVKRRKFIEVAPHKSKLKNWEFYFEVDKHKKPKLGATNLDFHKSFEEKLTKSKRWTSDQDAVKISILHFINTFLLCDLPENKVPNWHFEVVESGDYETYPWGKLVFHETFASLKNVLRGKIGKKFSKLYGFPLAFQDWFYECCAQSNEQFAIMIGKRIPRILSWKVLSSPNATKVSEMLSSTKLKVRNISATLFEKSAMNLNDLVGDVVVNYESNGAEVASQLVDDDFTTPPPVSSKVSRKPKSVPPMNNMNLIDEIRRISDGQKELREDFQVYEEFRGRDVNVDCDEEYYENNINCDQHVTLHLDNIQTINEDSNNDVKIVGEVETRELDPELLLSDYIDVPESQIHPFTCRVACKQIDKSCYPEVEHIVTGHLTRNRRPDAFHQSPYLNSYGSGDNMSGGASSKSIVTGVHPFGSFNMDVDCLKETGEFREWMNEGRRPRNKKYPYIKKDNTLNPPFEFGKTIISKKDWFYKFALNGQSLESSHLDVILYYLRKKGMHDDVPVKFTTTDYRIDLKIKALLKRPQKCPKMGSN
ncbi:hypothetical protein KY284_021165 [Solanum tuberosum]|nr:hypothetical protein KY284_021165 [Solanum tuberosum]